MKMWHWSAHNRAPGSIIAFSIFVVARDLAMIVIENR